MAVQFVAMAAAGYAVNAGLNMMFSPILDIVTRQKQYQEQFNLVLKDKLSWPLELSEYINGIVSGHYETGLAQIGIKYLGYKTQAKAYDDKFFTVTKREEWGDEALLNQQWIYTGYNIYDFAGIDSVIWKAQATLGITETLELLNRKNIDEKLANEIMLRNGFRDTGLIEAIYSLRNQIPPVADIIRFAVRDIFSPEIVTTFGYHKDFPPILDRFAGWQGLGWNTGIKLNVPAQSTSDLAHTLDVTWARAYWMSHWDLPSPTQGFQMLQRLYADSPFGPSPFLKSVYLEEGKTVEFGQKELELLLKANDYPEYWRPRLTAIAYSTLTLTDMKRMYRLGSLDEAGLYHAIRAYGYSPEDSLNVLKYIKALERPSPKGAVLRALKQGIIDSKQAIDMLRESGLAEREARQWVTNYELDKNSTDTARMIRYVRKGMLDGILDSSSARSALGTIGIVPSAISTYIQEWSAMVQYTRRFPTLAKFIKWAIDGVMSIPDLTKRLGKLRYEQEDIARIVAEVNQQRGIIQFKEAQKAAKAKGGK